jgi:hypothetical protein
MRRSARMRLSGASSSKLVLYAGVSDWSNLPEVLMDVPIETRRLLVELAYTACVTNQIEAARKLLAGLAVIAHGSREVVIGESLVALTVGDAETAISHLRPLAEAHDPYGVVFLGLALKLAGRTAESDSVLAGVSGGEPDVEALAATLR